MTNAKHTPGPWEFYCSGYDDSLRYRYVVRGEKRLVANVLGATEARLIAAAPDMLGALKYVLPFVQGLHDETGGTGADALNLIEAVIAKAEGAAS